MKSLATFYAGCMQLNPNGFVCFLYRALIRLLRCHRVAMRSRRRFPVPPLRVQAVCCLFVAVLGRRAASLLVVLHPSARPPRPSKALLAGGPCPNVGQSRTATATYRACLSIGTCFRTHMLGASRPGAGCSPAHTVSTPHQCCKPTHPVTRALAIELAGRLRSIRG